MLGLKYQSDCMCLTYISTSFSAQRAVSAARSRQRLRTGRGDAGCAGMLPQHSERQLWQRRPQRGSGFGAGTNFSLLALCPPWGLQKQQLCPSQTQPNLAKASQSRYSGMKLQDALQDEHTPSARSRAWAAGAAAGFAFYSVQTRGLVPHSHFKEYLL